MSNVIDAEWNAQLNALLYRIQQQDSLALKLLYDMAASRLSHVLMRIVNNTHDTEDLLQDVFVKVWQQSDKYTQTGTAWGWLCVLARNSAIDRLRSAKNRQYESTDASPDLLNALVEVNDSVDAHWIGRCLTQLKPTTREVIMLSYVNGYSHGELSHQLSIPLGTVKAWIRRGLQELKQCLTA